MKAEGTHSKAPLTEAFGQWKNAKSALLALFGLVAGQAVVWYTGQFYALFFLTAVLKVDVFTGNVLIAWSLVLGTGGFILFGWLSDKIGRKPIILGGCLIAALTYFPLFQLLAETANPALAKAHEARQGRGRRRSGRCSFQFNPDRHRKFTNPATSPRAPGARLGGLLRRRMRRPAPSPGRSATRPFRRSTRRGRGVRRRASSPPSPRRWPRR